MAPVVPNPDAIMSFADARSFEEWLARNHDSASELWLKVYKKGSGVASVTIAEALDVVLCWGWIDGIRKGLDEKAFLQRYTPRGRKSIWSQINRDHIERLTAAGRMRPPGQAQVDAAKADGRWDAAYAAGSKMEIPVDLMKAIEADPAALATFHTLSRQNRFSLAFRIVTLKTAAGREKKIRTFVEMLVRGETIYANPPPRKATTQMSLYVAFLRGINLGKRQMKMADLKTCLEDIGLIEVKTILASGNARFEATDGSNLKERLEAALEERFGYPVGVVLRSRADIEAMLAADPFTGVDPKADVKRYILMFDRDLPAGVTVEGAPGDFDVLRIDPRDIYFLAHRLPNGRYGESLDRIGKALDEQIGKGRVETMRNWNTIEKALK